MKPTTFAPVYVCLYPILAEITRKHGYALTVHGTVITDFDLVAVPWVEKPSSVEDLFQAIVDYLNRMKDTFEIRIYGPEKKPQGRIVWLLSFYGTVSIDLSVMPVLKENNESTT